MVTDLASAPPSRAPFAWLANQPYLLLSLTSLFWAGNAIVGRYSAGHIPPVTLSFIRWTGALLVVLPFAWPYLKRDWPLVRARLGVMLVISITGISAFNTLQYSALEYTQALNVLLLQSAVPLVVAVWSLVLLGVRLTWAQAAGIAASICGVMVILLRGDLTALGSITFNRGDLIFTVGLVVIGFYSVMTLKRPAIHPWSFLAFTFGCGALFLVPPLIWELMARPVMHVTVPNLLSLGYVIVFPSVLSYLCFNRGVQLIGANRAAPFFHLIPVFGAAMAIFFLGETMHLFHVIGFALVIAGVFFAARKPRNTTSAA
ncbi:MAG: multidrug DMT transporter permease [Rhizobiales bacterium 62-47]|nr:MAG: multidrug DMT transporter permease [Rhizobiales bacterium 62-47]